MKTVDATRFPLVPAPARPRVDPQTVSPLPARGLRPVRSRRLVATWLAGR